MAASSGHPDASSGHRDQYPEASAADVHARPLKQSVHRIVAKSNASHAARRSYSMRDVASDGSPFDLNPVNPRQLIELMDGVDEMIDAGVNDSTYRGEESAWRKYYLPYCRAMRTAPWREFEARRRPAHENKFLCGFALHVWREMKPRSAKDKAPRVDSVRNVLTARGTWRRV
jgi:hypothetical protein